MKEIGIVVCNYNKEDYIVNCISSILESSFNQYDLYVVDNASTDRSVERIIENFGNRVQLIKNQDNLGGSGGFNTGLREALKKDYQFLMLFDNDIIVDKYAIEELYRFLIKHPDVGMVGSKVYFMDFPKQIWGYGGKINFETYLQEDNFKNAIDGTEIPELVYCDYVAACSLMVRTDAVKQVGLMPEENFIYWDDMEWGFRFNKAGYKVAVCGSSKIWHKAGGRSAGNTFINYYMWRNRIRFFLKILPKENIEHFSNVLLSDMFRLIYSCNLKGELNIIRSVMYAFDDAIHGVSNRAADYKILPRTGAVDRVAMAIGKRQSILLNFNGNYEGLGNILRKLENIPTVKKIAISVINCPEEYSRVKEKFPQHIVERKYEPDSYEFHMNMCKHIFDLEEDVEEDIYIDPWCNIIAGQQDFNYSKNYIYSRDIFLVTMKSFFAELP